MTNSTGRPRRTRWVRWAASLKTRLALLCVLAVAVGVFSAAALVLAQAREHTVEILHQAEQANAEWLANVIGRRVSRLQDALRLAAEAVPLDRLDDREALAAYMRQRQVLSTLFATIQLADAQGRVLARRDAQGIGHPALAVGHHSFFAATIESGRPVVSEPIGGAGEPAGAGEAMLQFTMPVGRNEHGAPMAVLIGGLRLGSPDLLADLVSSAASPLSAGAPGAIDAGGLVQTVVVDRQGIVLAHPELRRVARPLSDDSDVARVWLAGDTGKARPDANDLLSATALVSDQGWTVLRVASARRMLAGFDTARKDAAIVSMGVAACVGLLILVWLMRLLRPLEQLEQRARALLLDDAHGNGGWPVADGEIGELVLALRMAVHRRNQAEARTKSLLEQLQSVLHTAPIGIAFSRDRHFDLVSDEFCTLLGRRTDQLVGQPARTIYAHHADYEQLGPRVGEAFAQRHEFASDLEFVRGDGTHFLGELRGRPVRHDDPGAGTIWLLRDVTRERAEHRKLAWSATHDGLTGLFNRRHFEAELLRLLPTVSADTPAALLFIDLDHFKGINDQAGHAEGDRVLRQVADALSASVRRDGIVARLGGDEFVIALVACSLDQAQRVAETLRAALGRIEVRHDGERLPIGASIGVVPIPVHGAGADGAGVPIDAESVARVLGWADQACYEAKHAGRDRVHTGVGADLEA
ncbi:MAG TPA: diguanylate cyclase [Burkholderiaceae bacterium]|nr:diguanylate cyclase [Burkholderiaceae bacterium]HMX09936.1 diguanylate cyclase [Burkholderiaceae bacterium]HNB42874.1 diguanylate cyclase [Burkholderiaceae bacterium]HNG78546.1 diguanylate cyclase [Burkholderiaceae bacterium]